MGSIPIIANGQWQAPLTPLQEAARVAQLQQQQQQVQASQLENQKQQQALKDQQAQTQAMLNWDGKDYNELAQSVLKNGGSAQAVQAIQKHGMDLRNTASQIAQHDAETGSKHLDTIIKQHDVVLGALQAAEQVPDEQLGQHIQDTVNSLAAQGMIDPPLIVQAKQMAQLPPDQMRQQLKLFENNMKGSKDQFQQAQEERKTAAEELRAQTEAAKAAKPPAQEQEFQSYYKSFLGANNAQPSAALEYKARQEFAKLKQVDRVAERKAEAEQNATPLDQITNTTMAGRKYISATDLPKDKYASDAVRKAADAAGVPIVQKDVADALAEIDTAKKNQDYMLSLVSKKLASGAPERLWYGPANTIERMAQSDPEMASVGTFRNAAIQSMRAVAGARGLRINQAEINMAIDNDIPKLTDTLPVAEAKLKNLKQFLENSEASHLERNRSGNAAPENKGGGFDWNKFPKHQ